MTTSMRDEILNSVRQSCNASSAQAVDDRIGLRQPNVVPARGGGGDKISHVTFVEEAGLAGADIECVDALKGVPAALAAYLKQQESGGNLRLATDPLMQDIPWEQELFLKPASGAATGEDGVGVSIALAGIAETGSVMMASSPERPAMLNVLPLINVVLLPESRIVGNYEQSLNLVRGNMPRMVTYITGPSRTADIELELLMGAHGPQRLLIMLIGEA
ncbi:MAG: LUD domain-containing protein [Rhodospirillales bacterium]|jgi:L-lactate utilization protein LutC|nr:LUD domain-containing protein [Rhodospirillales bacterium]